MLANARATLRDCRRADDARERAWPPRARRDSVRGNADADRAAHPGAAKPAIALRILGQILLVVVLGEVERRRIADFGGDRAQALGGKRLGVGGTRRFGGGTL